MATPDTAPQPTDDNGGTIVTTPNPREAQGASPRHYFFSSDRSKPLPPQRDPHCARCMNPTTTPYRFNEEQKGYNEGEIVRIRESVHAPIDHLFVNVENKKRIPQFLAPDKNPRPGVVVGEHGIELRRDETAVYLMATYLGIHTFARLPPVLQHFCLPVAPHCEIDTDVAHLHTSPEWQKTNAWLIAFPFVSFGEVLGRWEWRGRTDTSGLSLYVDREGLQQLVGVHEQRWDEWEAQCTKHKGFIEARYEEYQEFKRQGLETSKKLKSARPARSPGEGPITSSVSLDEVQKDIPIAHLVPSTIPIINDPSHFPNLPMTNLTPLEASTQGKAPDTNIIPLPDVVGPAPAPSDRASPRKGTYAQAVATSPQGNQNEEEDMRHTGSAAAGGTRAGKTKKKGLRILFSTFSQRNRN